MVRASLGKEGGAFTQRRQSATATAIEATYPMYGIKVTDLMAMTAWVPHQELLEQGKLHQITEERVIFLSHQWCSFNHPDPNGDQLKALQVVLQRLHDGEVEVRTHPKMELAYNYKRIDGKAEWEKFFAEGFIWHDFSCIPQPLAHKARLEGADGCAGARAHAGMVGSDHRTGDCGEDEVMVRLVRDLKAAVDSIPSYVERAEKVWVLVPPVAHVDVPDAVCDFNSWRGRGWCRMEYCASNLTTHDLPVMVIKNAVDPPEYFSPCDAMKTPATGGCFSFADDRAKVLDVLQTMVTAKAKYYADIGDVHLARLMRCFAPMMTGGIDRHTLESVPEDEGESAVSRLKRRMFWRDDATEAAWSRATGWNLMTLAAMTDDLAAVRELCAQPGAVELMAAVGKKIKVTQPHQKLPFAQMLLSMSHGHLPLMGAMGYARPELVTTLLQAGCPVPKGSALLDTFCGSPCHRPTGAIFNGRVDNCEAFLQVHPNAVDLSFRGDASTFFQNFLHVACGVDRPNIKPAVEWLLGKGLSPLLRSRMGVGATPFGCLVFNEDADLSVLPLLVAADPEFAKADMVNAFVMPHTMVWGMFHAWRVLGAMGHKSSGAMARMFGNFIVTGTPLHWACMNGNLPMISALLDLGADPTIRARRSTKSPGCKGLTPFELLCHKYPDSAAIPACAKLLEAKGFGHCVTGAKVNRKREGLAKAKHASLVESLKLLSVTPPAPPAKVLPAPRPAAQSGAPPELLVEDLA